MTNEEIRDVYYAETSRGNGIMTNSEAIAMTYYEYHGKHDDGDSLVDYAERGVLL